MENSRTKALLSDEGLLMLGICFAILGFYVMAEWQMIVGLMIVSMGYTTIIATNKIARQKFQMFIPKLNSIENTRRIFERIYLSIKTFCVG